MKIDCSQLGNVVHALPLVRACDQLKSGTLRISTPFTYPNGEYVDVFLITEENLLQTLRLSDLGQTSLYLRSALVSMPGTARRREIVADIASQLNVKYMNGSLYVLLTSEDVENLSMAILKLSQACVRISDLATHQRLRSVNSFRDDVEEFFDAHNFIYTPDIRIKGPANTDIRMDFEVRGRRENSYVNVLAALNETAAKSSALDIFAKWYDLTKVRSEPHKLVTVFNSASTAIREEDLARLREYSDLVSYPEEADFLVKVLND